MMLMPSGPQTETGPNHPRARRMAVIAFLNQAITTGSAWGSFSVLLTANEARLGITRAQSTLAVPAILLVLAFAAPLVGILATRYPMRRVSVAGAVCSCAGFLLLAVTGSYPLYLVGYGLLLGPGLAVGSIMPSTIVTRWFSANRGKALGLVNIPLVFTIMPLAATRAVHSYGLPATYLMLAGLAVVTLVANLLIADPPPAGRAVDDTAAQTDAAKAATEAMPPLGNLLKNRRFWLLALGANALTVGSIIVTTHIVPMAESWGDTTRQAALLLSVFSLVAMAGPIFYGWVGDRLGGARTLAVLILGFAVLWLILLLQPPFPVTIVVMGLLGFHAIAASPILSLALSEVFGAREFSRAFGMANVVALPFTIISAPIAGLVYARTHTYSSVIVAEIVFLLVMFFLVLTVRRRAGVALREPVPNR